MKKVFVYFFLALILIVGCSQEFKETFNVNPMNPQPTQEITVRYNPSGTPLGNADDVALLAYSFTNDQMPSVQEVNMDKKGKGWIGSFTPDSGAVLVMAKFVAGEAADDNNEQGYKIMLFNDDGKYVQGCQAALANVFLYGAYPMRLKRDVMRAAEEFQNELTLYPDSKERFRELGWNLTLRTDKENGNAKVLAELDTLASKPDLTIEEKTLLASWYNRLKATDKADKFKQAVLKAEPKGELAQSERIMEFYNRKNLLNQKIRLFKNFKKDFPENERLGYMASNIINGYVQEKRFDEAQDFLNRHVDNPTSMHYNTIAWALVENEVNLKTAAELGKKGTELARAELENPTSEKPTYLTDSQWKNQLKTSLGYILDTYATALYKSDQVEESLPLFEEAVEVTKKGNNDVNERYAGALLDAGQNEKTFHFVEELLKDGKSTPKLEDMFKKAYVGWKGSEEGLDEALSALSEQGINKLKSELEKEMLNKPAPEFTLEDLEGNSVSLTDLKGKTLVIDFWATWCGPCISSFPGMQDAVNKFKDDESVKFLFVNTWERGDNVKENVAKFIKDKNYTFHVLLDLKSEVVAAYGVDGIPTKFVVDKNGNIRFKSVGFGGDANKLVEELSLMIEMVK